jgi:mono/diheme cytochrome c family protein
MKKTSMSIAGILLCVSLGVLGSVAVSLAADPKAGQAVYSKACKNCHGADGTPNANIAKMMKVDMKDLKAPEVQAMSTDDIKKIITSGTGKMKGISSVTGSSVDDVAAYVKSLKK